MKTKQAIGVAERQATKRALGLLVHHFGYRGAARVLGRVVYGQLRGEPFRRLGPASSRRERLSRRQCGGAVLLDRAIARASDADTASSIVGEVISTGGMEFLEKMVPNAGIEQMRVRAAEVVDSFFNAEGQTSFDDDGSFRFDVHRCHFVELLGKVDASHLARHFCQVDERFFTSGQRPIQLRRTGTIASGGSGCDFHFSPLGDE